MRTLLITLLLLLSGCDAPELQAPPPPARVVPVPADWQTHVQTRNTDKASYLQQHQVAYQWFANFPFSETDGTPFILLKLLPQLAPDIWGTDSNFMASVGLFVDERQADFPAPLGIGFSGLSQGNKPHIDYASVTCGACHIGRVQLADGSFEYLEGGVNTRFNFPLMRTKLTATVTQLLGGDIRQPKPAAMAQLIEKILTQVDKVHTSDSHFFYNNYQFGNQHFDADYEAAQIAQFKQQAAQLIPAFVQRVAADDSALSALLAKNYADFKTQMHAGIPGMVDATGLSTANAYADIKKKPVLGWFASVVLPTTQGLADFMSVWEQGKRKASWSSDHKELINGGGQWNGSVPIPMYRNIAAELTLGLANTDLRVAAFADELLVDLPANPYPFAVDEQLARQGQALFSANCADCHQPHNGKVYSNLGTPMERANIVNWITERGARSGFYSLCNKDTVIELEGKPVKPCAEFEGVSLADKKSLSMRALAQQRGYNARPLSGIWAQAPYLHNGSVPTLYHLLVASERPTKFLRGIEEYDQDKLGFVWRAEDVKFSQSLSQAVEFDTRALPALNAKGHSGLVKEGGKTYKLDWSDDKVGARALMEYLKTL